MNARIIHENSIGGELDSRLVEGVSEEALSAMAKRHLIEMIEENVVDVGDRFVIVAA